MCQKLGYWLGLRRSLWTMVKSFKAGQERTDKIQSLCLMSVFGDPGAVNGVKMRTVKEKHTEWESISYSIWVITTEWKSKKKQLLFFFSVALRRMSSSPARERARTSRGDRERKRETCDFSLYWIKSWGRFCCCRLLSFFLYKQSLHAVNSLISRLHFTLRRSRRSLLFSGSGRSLPVSLWAILDKQKHQVHRRFLGGSQLTHLSGVSSAEKRTDARPQTAFRLLSRRLFYTFTPPGRFLPPL